MKKSSQRVRDILAKMTVEEKALQLSCIVPMFIAQDEKVMPEKMDAIMPQGIGRMTQFSTGFFSGPRSAAEGYNAIQKYIMEHSPSGVPAIMQNESAAGLVAEGATVFPVPIAVASTWRPELARKMGEVIRHEAKAIGVSVAMSPVADVARDSRWGRVGETFGEDPLLCARFSAEKVKGIQGDDYSKNVMSCAKHFMGYSASEGGINTAVINMGKKDLFEVYGTPFAAAIKEADMQYVMVTYSEIDGLPMSVNEYYMRDVLRQDMAFDGVAICDGGSIPRCMQMQGMYQSPEELAGRALRAGIDADTPFTQVYNKIKDGVEKGLVNEADLDESVLRILAHKEEMGLLDDPFVDPEAAVEVFARAESRAVSAEITRQELTLLKNEGALPMKKGARVALTGPFANRLSTLFGGYAYPSFVEMIISMSMGHYGIMEGVSEFFEKMMDKQSIISKLGIREDASYEENVDGYIRRAYKDIETLYEALQKGLDGEVVYAPAVSNGEGWEQEIEAAVEAAKGCEVIVATVGEVTGFGKDATSGEGVNNPDLRLPGHQEALVRALAALGKPLVLVLFNGRPLALGDVEPLCDAILEVWYPGPAGGQAVAEALCGQLNPGGKLPVSFPRISAQCPLYYGHKAGSGYTKIDGSPDKSVLQPLYPFGHGLSYTCFDMDGLEVPGEVAVGGTFKVKVTVTNTGKVAGDEVVQVYTRTKTPTVVRPVKELRAFRRVSLAPGEKKTLSFTLDTHQFGYYDYRDEFVIESGGLEVMVGASSGDIRQKGETRLVGESLEILHTRSFGFEVE